MADVGSAETHRKQRQKLRKRLRAQGLTAAEIERRVDELVRRQRARRRDDGDYLHWYEIHRAVHRPRDHHPDSPDSPDDRGYRPARLDPLQQGPARVTAITALASRRRKALTRDEWARLQEGS